MATIAASVMFWNQNAVPGVMVPGNTCANIVGEVATLSAADSIRLRASVVLFEADAIQVVSVARIRVAEILLAATATLTVTGGKLVTSAVSCLGQALLLVRPFIFWPSNQKPAPLADNWQSTADADTDWNEASSRTGGWQ